jgi:hypothetical protein
LQAHRLLVETAALVSHQASLVLALVAVAVAVAELMLLALLEPQLLAVGLVLLATPILLEVLHQ